MADVACANCGGNELYRTKKPVSAGGGHAPNYLRDSARNGGRRNGSTSSSAEGAG